jgi:hypothetical protein
MRFLTVLIGVLALSGSGRALAHEQADEHDHEGCCCRHDQHHSHDPSAKSTSEKPVDAKEQESADQKTPESSADKPPDSPADNAPTASPK